MLWPKKGNLIQTVSWNLDELSQRQRGTCCGLGTVVMANYCVSVHQCTILAITFCLTCVATSYSLCYRRCGSICLTGKNRLWNLGCTNYQFFFLVLSCDATCSTVFNNQSRSQSTLHWTLCHFTDQSDNLASHSRKNRGGSNKGVKQQHCFCKCPSKPVINGVC